MVTIRFTPSVMHVYVRMLIKMTWDDTDRTELDKHIDEIEDNAYNFGIQVGRGLEHQRIIELLQAEASEWLSHDGECDCRHKGDEVLRLIKKIEESK